MLVYVRTFKVNPLHDCIIIVLGKEHLKPLNKRATTITQHNLDDLIDCLVHSFARLFIQSIFYLFYSNACLFIHSRFH